MRRILKKFLFYADWIFDLELDMPRVLALTKHDQELRLVDSYHFHYTALHIITFLTGNYRLSITSLSSYSSLVDCSQSPIFP